MAKTQTTLRNIRKRAATLARSGKLAEARALYTTGCNDHPSDSRLWLSLAQVNHQLGLYGDAEHCTRQALSLDPASSEGFYYLAGICLEGGRIDQAIAHYRRTLDIDPAHTEALNNLSAILTNNGQIGESIQLLEQALKIHPNACHMMINLARAHLFSGDSCKALQILEHVIRLYPENAAARSKYLLCANYQSWSEPEQLFEQHRLWEERHAGKITRYRSYGNSATEQRPLRIAYLSPDLKNHSVAWFIEPILSHHDSKNFSIVGYADVANPDSTSQRLADLCSEWHWTRNMSDDQLCKKIRADQIDILVDLAGHTANNRLSLFARKPAPVAVSYLGYPNTTGLSTIDYRITDAIADPPGVADPYYTEELVRLANGFLCYRPPEDSPDIGAPPCRDSGRIVFGSFNNLAKLTDEVIHAWSRILLNTEGSRLLLKNKGTADPYTRERLQGLFAQQGVGQERLIFQGHTRGNTEHMRMYNKVDIALDPFPYNGTTTTCEALWMGVPVVTLYGNVHASRVSASLLSRIDLKELIATSAGDYIQTAIGLSSRHDRLVDLRHGLRERMRLSDLCDASSFTRNIEDAYRKMWHSYLNKISN